MTPDQYTVFEHIAERALASPADTSHVIGIDGKDAAGKTLFSDAFAGYLRSKTDREIIRISIDDFMNPRAVRQTPSDSLAESAYSYTFNIAAFKRHVLEPLQAGGSRVYKTRIFDETADAPDISTDFLAAPGAIVIIDGVLLYKADLAEYFSLRILLDVSDEVATERGIARDKARGKKLTDDELYAYRSIYIASQAIYYQKDRPRERAYIVIDNNDFLHPQLLSH